MRTCSNSHEGGLHGQFGRPPDRVMEREKGSTVLQLYGNLKKVFNEKWAEADPKILKNSLLLSLFSGNFGITVRI
jgi:hypothetical protein